MEKKKKRSVSQTVLLEGHEGGKTGGHVAHGSERTPGLGPRWRTKKSGKNRTGLPLQADGNEKGRRMFWDEALGKKEKVDGEDRMQKKKEKGPDISP